jgi:hypothetical protein
VCCGLPSVVGVSAAVESIMDCIITAVQLQQVGNCSC